MRNRDQKLRVWDYLFWIPNRSLYACIHLNSWFYQLGLLSPQRSLASTPLDFWTPQTRQWALSLKFKETITLGIKRGGDPADHFNKYCGGVEAETMSWQVVSCIIVDRAMNWEVLILWHKGCLLRFPWGSALIGSPPPISRPSSSFNHILAFSPPSAQFGVWP